MIPESMPAPACPRCGYDLAGAVATWTDTCPLRQLCSECGLDIELRLVLNPVLAARWDFYETAEVESLRALRRTVWRARSPRRFWRWVGMEQPIVAERAAWGAVMGMMVVYLAGGAALLLLSMIAPVLNSTAVPPSAAFPTIGVEETFLRVLRTVMVPVVAGPRGWYVDEWWTLFFGKGYLGLVSGVMLPLVMPLSFLLLPFTLRKHKVRRAHLFRIGAWSLIITPLFFQLAAIVSTFVAGWQRLFYSLGSAIPYGSWGSAWLHVHQPLLLPAMMALWVFCWWWAACRWYLRLPNGVGIAAAMVTLSFLAACVVGLVIGAGLAR